MDRRVWQATYSTCSQRARHEWAWTLILVSVLDNWNKAKEDFHFYEKSQIMRMTFCIFFQEQREGYRRAPASELHSAFWHWAVTALNCVCELLLDLDLFCASVSKVYPLAIALSCHLAYKSFPGNTLEYWGKTCIRKV